MYGFRVLVLAFSMCIAITAVSVAADKPLVFGLLLVGPFNGKGYSQAQYEGGRYVEKQLPGSTMLCLDKVNPVDRPGVTIPQVVDDLVAKGARLLFAGLGDR